MMTKNKLSLALITALVASSSVAIADPSSLIPVVPASQAKADLPPPPPTKKNVLTKHSKRGSSIKIDPKVNLHVSPGVNEIIPVAQNHLNRIVTPFTNPKVTSSSKSVSKKIRDNVIYIGSKQDAPLTLFITQEGSESQAISLTLIPKKIPPREIKLIVDEQVEGVIVTEEAKKWEVSQEYFAAIYQTMAGLARGDIPSGYKLTDKAVGRLPHCRQAGLLFDFTSDPQSAVGHHLIYHIGLATNNSDKPIEFMEESCGDWDIAAVGSFPRIVLNPGEQTEIFVAEKRNYVKSVKKARRSLLGGK